MARKQIPTNTPVAPAFDVIAWLGRYSTAGFVLLLVLATIRIVLTYDVFNHTIDEPAHIAAGMEWLDRHSYTYETQHPPLARVAAALGPWLAGAKSYGREGIYYEGAAILYGQNQYDRTLRLARYGILPFFWIGALGVFLWSRRAFGPGVGLLAALCFSTMPAILAHAGLATTDMALTAFLLWALFAAAWWAEKPTWGRAGLFGLAGGLAVLSKFSSLPFFACTVLIALAWGWFRNRPSAPEMATRALRHLPTLLTAAAIGAVLIWCAYRFSFSPFLNGLESVGSHQREGHISYLLGETSSVGFWYYYPVALLFKTPIGFLGLALFGFVLFWRTARDNAALRLIASLALALFGVGMWSNINIGTRHILPIFGAIAIFAAWGFAAAWKARAAWVRWTAVAALAWAVIGPAVEHPDYLAYFNELAGGSPEKILADSDLDWGQDMKRLAAKLHAVGAPSVAFRPFIIAHLEKVHGFPPIEPGDPTAPSVGWNAVSLTVLKVARLGLDPKEKAVPWPENVPQQQRVGKGVLLYYFAPRP